MNENWKLLKSIISGIQKNKIPNDPDEVKEMLRRLEHEEKIYYEKQNNIKKIKAILKAREDRKKQPSKVSIFYRCKKCHELVRKSEGHYC